MHLFVNNMADPDISDYELRNNSTVFEELEESIVDFFSQFQFWKYKNSLNIWIQ